MSRIRKLNRLTLGQGDPRVSGQWGRKEFLIDGRLLQEHIARATKSQAQIISSLGQMVSPLGWTNLDYEHRFIRQLMLEQESELASGRQELLVCPLCAGLGCGCISARIQICESIVEWRDIGYENGYDPESLEIYDYLSFSFELAQYRDALTNWLAVDDETLSRHP